MIFAADLHIRPWEIGLLTVEEFRQAVAAFEEQQKERAKGR